MRPLIFFCISFFVFEAGGQTARPGFLADKTAEWLVYDRSENTYLPFLEEKPVKTLHLRLDSGQLGNSDILIWLDSGTFVFENNDLKYAVSRSPLRVSRPELERTMLLSIWQKGEVWERAPKTWLVRKKWSPANEKLRDKEPEEIIASDVMRPKPAWMPQELILLTWILLLLVAVLRQGESSILRLSELKRISETLYKPVTEVKRINTLSLLISLFFYASVSAYTLAFLDEGGLALDNITQYFLVSAAYLLARFCLVLLFSGLYFDGLSLGWLQIRETLRFSWSLVSVLLLVTLFISLEQTPLSTSTGVLIVRYLAAILVVMRTLAVSYQIIRFERRINFYLISYLCTVEIIPAFFIMQYIS